MKVNISGKLVAKKDATVSVFDHGLLYGDGVFEGIRAYNGKVFLLEEHIERLYDSAKAICLKLSVTPEEMIQQTLRTCKANKIRNGYIRIVCTRGTGTLGLNPYLCKRSEYIIIAAKIQLYPKELYENGLNIVTVGTHRNQAEAVNPRIKSLNYLNNIMAKIEAINAGVMECIMLNHLGFVAEASGDNIFVVKGGELITPPSWCGSLEGITQEFVIAMAKEMGYTVRRDVLTRYELYTADEVFLTGTAAEIIGVVDIDKRVIGKGKPGPVTQSLCEEYRKRTASHGTPIA